MKKLLLAITLMFASVGVFADDFDQLVSMLKGTGAQQGWTVRANKERRIIFFEVKLDDNSDGITQEIFDAFKPAMVANFKKGAKEEGVAAIKQMGVTLYFTFITTDGKRFNIAITPQDL